jgi:hypothetical protein
LAFTDLVVREALVRSGRCCCICHRFCGTKIELHHIIPIEQGGDDSFENCIPVCFDCHADIGHYNDKHPRGRKYTSAELRAHRDQSLAIAKAVTMALSPLSSAVWGYELLWDWLQASLTARMAGTPPTQITSPPGHVAGPLLLHLRFLQSEEVLRELFAGLLACAMDSQRQREVHPAFVSVLQQLSPGEAMLLTHLSKKPGWTISDLWEERKITQELSLEKQFALVCRAAEVKAEDQAEAYMVNLIRLGVLMLRELSAPHLEPAGANDYGDWDAHLSEGYFRELSITSFGASFLAAVHYGSENPSVDSEKVAQPAAPSPEKVPHEPVAHRGENGRFRDSRDRNGSQCGPDPI